ncbi:MAG: CPBP family intramembrane metalloprotease [Ferruginibacter sp.]|nr:CPBP family intramembrane metalloprotease [Ferruginibacter sp.]
MSISAFDKLILFLRKGELIKESLSTGDKIIIAIRLYLYLILFSFLINLITLALDYNPLPESDIKQVGNVSAYLVFALYFIVPVYEEITFRLFLTKFKKSTFIISLSLLVSYTIYWLTSNNLPFLSDSNSLLMRYAYLVLFASLIGIIFFLLAKKINLKKISRIWNDNYLIIFYSISLLFVMLHFKTELIAISGIIGEVIYLIPILIFSLILGFLRANFGIVYAIFFHLLFNLPSTLIRHFLL